MAQPAPAADGKMLRICRPLKAVVSYLFQPSSTTMFISGRVLDWNYYTEDGSGLSCDEENEIVWRAHEIWRHASSLISRDCSEFVLSDAISNLKRAVNHRLQALSQAYSFDALPFSNQKQTLEKFQFCGIIRPALLKELFLVNLAPFGRSTLRDKPRSAG